MKKLEHSIKEFRENHSNIEFIVLYGSFATGKQKKWSDVDIGVYYKGKKIPTISKIIDLDRPRLVSFICRKITDLEKSLKDPYNWIQFAKRIEHVKLLYQKGKAFKKFVELVKKIRPEPVDFHQYTGKFLADVLDYLGKMRNTKEKIYKSKYSKVVAISCFWMLSSINKLTPFNNENELRFYLQLKRKPKKFNRLFKKIFREEGTAIVKNTVEIAQETIRYAEKAGIFKSNHASWYFPLFESKKVYDFL